MIYKPWALTDIWTPNLKGAIRAHMPDASANTSIEDDIYIIFIRPDDSVGQWICPNFSPSLFYDAVFYTLDEAKFAVDELLLSRGHFLLNDGDPILTLI